jgi:hypothetical protein
VKNRKSKLLVLAILALLVASCAKRAATPGVPATPVTPMEQFASTNATIATTNHAIEQGVAQLNAAGVLSDSLTRTILDWHFTVADTDKQITLIVQSSASAATKGQQIRALISQLKTSAVGLVNNGELGVKNPASQQSISADIQAILTLCDAIVLDLQNGGVIQ